MKKKMCLKTTQKKWICNNTGSFNNILENSSLSRLDKNNIKYIFEYFKGKHNLELSSRSFLFYGEPGVGKTFLAEQLLKAIGCEVLCMGCESFDEKTWTRFEKFDDLVSAADNPKKQILFLDDLSYLLERDDGEVITVDQRSIMKVLNLVKKNSNKILIATLNDFSCLDNRMVDRIEVKIMFDLPSNEHKKKFLKSVFSNHLKESYIKYISENTIGYNYRDLPELIRLSYRLGLDNITEDSVKEAIKRYRPTQLYGFSIQTGIEINLSNIIGKEKALGILKRVVDIYKNDKISKKLDLKRNNLLLFHGPPGTGKSFTANAIAGEIGFPLIRIHARDIYQRAGPFGAVEMITDMARRFQNCIIFIDEAEKLLGNGRYEEDSPVLGELHQCLDNGYGKEIQSILIMAINDPSRFGNTLLDRFVQIPFTMPSFEERVRFFKIKIGKIQGAVKINLSSVHLANITDNMSYRDMDRYWNDIMFAYIDDKNASAESILDKVKSNFAKSSSNQIMYV